MTGPVLDFIKNWNFLIPLVLWLGRESYVRLKMRNHRTRVWGLRRSRSIRLVIDEQRISENYLTGDVGPLAEARAVQKVLAHFRHIGIAVRAVPRERFDRSGAGDLIIVGTLRGENSLAVAMLHLIGEDVGMSGEMVRLRDRELDLDLQLTDEGLKVGTEYGIFAREANPDEPRRALIILTALTSKGLEMATDVLVSPKVLSTVIHDKGPGMFLIGMDSNTGRTSVEALRPVLQIPRTDK